jgi:hypothetical protein
LTTAEIIQTCLAAAGGAGSIAAGMMKMWTKTFMAKIEGVNQRVANMETTLKERSNNIEGAVRAETDHISGEIKKLDGRLYAHAADENRHVTPAWIKDTAEWRIEMAEVLREMRKENQERGREMERRLFELAQK